MAEPIELGLSNRAVYDQTAAEFARLRENLVESGLVELLNGLLEEGPAALAVVMDRMDNPSTRQGVENLARFMGLAGQLDPSILKGVQQGLRESAAEAARTSSPKFSEIVRSLGDPKVRKGLAIGLAMLRGLGGGSR
ncbi:MAG: DUF1641 domain-containing protein [Actinomycetota bacterium]|nr:DUF1641 domain-containing protein [Actinomycetota bacterium]MDA8396659.1 DUF1641 domain-containing protein [Actinomycetota bacterium]